MDGSLYVPLHPRRFVELLKFLQSRFHLTTFEDDSGGSRKPSAILSFDDGYKDFVDVAAPILRSHRIRCNHNVIPDCIETQRPPLNVLAQDFLGKAPEDLVRRLYVPGFSLGRDSDAGLRLSMFIKNKSQVEQRRIAEVLLPQFYTWDGFRPTPMMTLPEVLQVGREHELGAHSYSHASMEFETDAYLAEDVARCQEYFLHKLERSATIYAFPNGSCRRGQPELVRRLGIRHILLVGEDFDRKGDCHPRFTFHARSSAEVRFRATGSMKAIPS